jgi:hypothetical protein
VLCVQDRNEEFIELSKIAVSNCGVWENMPQIGILHGYFDESGKWKDKDCICCAGWVGTPSRWEPFVKDWRAVLDKYGMDELHCSEFMSLSGQYAPLRKFLKATDLEPILLEFSQVIRDWAWSGYSIGLYVKDYKALPQAFREKVKNPHYLVFRLLMDLFLDLVDESNRMVHGAIGAFFRACTTFDQDPETANDVFKWYNKFRTQDKRARFGLTAVCFANSSGAIPLQAADLLGYATSKEMERVAGNQSEPSDLWKSFSVRPFPGKGPNPVPLSYPMTNSLILTPAFLQGMATGQYDQILKQIGI